jgi:phosphatidylglycerol---prolipoprotein diacylglyceryl transferase
LTLSEKRAEHNGISKDHLNNLIFFSLIAFVLAGRIASVLENIPAFSKSPISAFSINPDLFDPFGALIFASLASLIYVQRRGLPFWSTLDAITLFLAALAVGLGLSHLAAGTAFGKETQLPWGIELWNARRHPTQIYETIASLLTLGLLWFKKPDSRSGIFFLNFVSITAAWQLFIQAFRGDSRLVVGGFHQGQVIAWIVLAISFVMLEIRLTRGSPASDIKE